MNALVRRLLLGLLGLGAIATAGDQTGPKPTPAPTTGPGLEEFIPSEKVPADRAVAFPVDI